MGETRTLHEKLLEVQKTVTHLQKNMKVLIHSENRDIRSAYEEIQRRIGHILREIDAVRQ